MWGFIGSIIVFWILANLFNSQYEKRRRASSRPDSPLFTFSLSTFVAKLETESFNQLPSALLESLGIHTAIKAQSQLPSLSKSRTQRERNSSRRILSIFYEVGTFFAFGASILSLLIIAYGFFQLVNNVKDLRFMSSVGPEVIKLTKRSETPPAPSKSSAFKPSITPLIPGVTLPLWHLPFMVVALLLAQVIHEAGHAIAGAMNGLKPLRMGVLLAFPILPGAFVVLPDEAFDTDTSGRISNVASSSDRLRNDLEDGISLQVGRRGKVLNADSQLSILAAGVWHNAFTFGLLILMTWVGIGTFWRGLAWAEVNGMSVTAVDSSSPLAYYLSAGDVITHLDDLAIDVVPEPERQRLWRHFLLEESPIQGSLNQDGKTSSPHWSLEQEQSEELGWCMDSQAWKNLSRKCCDKLDLDLGTIPSAIDPSEVEFCFMSSGKKASQRCLDPLPLINVQEGRKAPTRCIESCEDSKICVRSDPREELVRIGVVALSEPSIPKVVLFQGSRQAVHLALNVSPIRQRWWFLPTKISDWIDLTTSYFMSLSLALAILNMLPLPHLDGDVFLVIAARKWLRKRKESRLKTSGINIGMERRRENASRGARDVAGRFLEDDGEGLDEIWLMKIRRRVHWLVGVFAVTVLCGSTLLHLILGS